MSVDGWPGSAGETGAAGAHVCSTGTRPVHQTSATDLSQINLGEGVELRLRGMERSQETLEDGLMF